MKGEEKVGFSDIITLIIGLIGISSLFFLYYLNKIREKKAFHKKFKTNRGLYEKIWKAHFKDGVSRWITTEKDKGFMKDITEVGKNLIKLARNCPPEIPDEIVDKILTLGLIIRDFGTHKPIPYTDDPDYWKK